MKEILENIVVTWLKTSDFSLRKSCRNHVQNINSWRYVVSNHQFRGVDIFYPVINFNMVYC